MGRKLPYPSEHSCRCIAQRTQEYYTRYNQEYYSVHDVGHNPYRIFLSNIRACIFPSPKYTYFCNYPKDYILKSAFIQKVVHISFIERHESTILFFLTGFSLEEKKSTFSSRRLLLNFSGLRFTSMTSRIFSFKRKATISSSACW